MNASDLAKAVITNSAQNDLIKIMNALNAIATSLAGCTPQIFYSNDLNISTSCFSVDCSSTGLQCQAQYLQLAIDQLTIALNTATYNLNLTSSILIGSGWNFPSLSTIITQWSIVEASAASYQSSIKTGPLISSVNSRFKTALSGSLSATNFFLNSFETGYKALIIAVINTDYIQTIYDYITLISLSASTNAEKSLLTGSFVFDGIILKSSSTQLSVSGISITSFVRPIAIMVFDKLDALSSSFNTELKSFQSNMQSMFSIQQQNFSALVQFKANRFSSETDRQKVVK